jgi:hypothetical protein
MLETEGQEFPPNQEYIFTYTQNNIHKIFFKHTIYRLDKVNNWPRSHY